MPKITLTDGSVLEVEHLPHDDGSERLVDDRPLDAHGLPTDPVVREAGAGWVAVTSHEPNPITGKLEWVARWIDAAMIAKTEA